MSLLESLFAQGTVERWGWMLVHVLWQATVVAVLLAIFLRLLRHAGANVRYLTACSALTLMVVLPIVTLRLMKVPGPAAEAGPPSITATLPPVPAPTPDAPAADSEHATRVEYGNNGMMGGRPANLSAVPDSVNLPFHPSPVPWHERVVSVLQPALPYVVLGWLVGVFGLSAWHLGGWAQLQRLRRRMVRTLGNPLQRRLAELSDRLGMHRAIGLLESALVEVPTVVGWLRPVILLPASALTGLPPAQLEAILAHELAHIRRFDYLVNILQTVVEILGFYHPAIWWVSHRIRVERENCCDDLAVQVCGSSLQYAKALAGLEEIRHHGTDLALAATGGSLMARIARLLGRPAVDDRRFTWLPGLIALVLVIGIILPAAFALTTASPPGGDAADQALPQPTGSTDAGNRPSDKVTTKETPEPKTDGKEDRHVATPAPAGSKSKNLSSEGETRRVRLSFKLVKVWSDLRVDRETLMLITNTLGKPPVTRPGQTLDLTVGEALKRYVVPQSLSPQTEQALVDLLQSGGYLTVLTQSQVWTQDNELVWLRRPTGQIPSVSLLGADLIDLGMNIKVTPHVVDRNHVTLDMMTELIDPVREAKEDEGSVVSRTSAETTVTALCHRYVIWATIESSASPAAPDKGRESLYLMVKPSVQGADLDRAAVPGASTRTSPRQILLDVRTVTMERGTVSNLGVEWSWPTTRAGVFPGGDATTNATAAGTWPQGVQVGYTPDQQFTDSLLAVLDVLQKEGRADLSSQQILTQDGRQAQIKALTEEWFTLAVPATKQSSPSHLEPHKTDWGTVLSVTPYVGDNNEVTLTMAVEVSDGVKATGSGLPVVTRRTAKNSVTVRDGGTVALGGLVESRTGSDGRPSRETAFFVTIHLVHEAEATASPTSEPEEMTPPVSQAQPQAQEPAPVIQEMQQVIDKGLFITLGFRAVAVLVDKPLDRATATEAAKLLPARREKSQESAKAASPWRPRDLERPLEQFLEEHAELKTLDGPQAETFLDLLLSHGYAQQLANPTMTMIDGQRAQTQTTGTLEAADGRNAYRLTFAAQPWWYRNDPNKLLIDVEVLRQASLGSGVPASPSSRVLSHQIGVSPNTECLCLDGLTQWYDRQGKKMLFVLTKVGEIQRGTPGESGARPWPSTRPQAGSTGRFEIREQPAIMLLSATPATLRAEEKLDPRTAADASVLVQQDFATSPGLPRREELHTASVREILPRLAEHLPAEHFQDLLKLLETRGYVRRIAESAGCLQEGQPSKRSIAGIMDLDVVGEVLEPQHAVRLDLKLALPGSLSADGTSDRAHAPVSIPALEWSGQPVIPNDKHAVLLLGGTAPGSDGPRETYCLILRSSIIEPQTISAPGPKVAATFLGADLLNVLAEISQRTGVKIIPDATVKTTPVTAELAEASPETALQQVLKNTPYAFRKMNDNAYLVFRPLSFTFPQVELAQALRDLAAAAGVPIILDPNVTGPVNVTCESVSLEEALQMLLAGKPYLFKKTPDYYLVASRNLTSPQPPRVRRIDRPKRQVLLEARVVAIEPNELQNLGVAWAWPPVRSLLFSSGGKRETQTPIGRLPDRIATDSLMMTLSQLQENSRADMIANPKVVALDGRRAEMKVVQEQWFMMTAAETDHDSAGRSELRKLESGTVLAITPQVGDHNDITLVLAVAVDDSLPPASGSKQSFAARHEITDSIKIQDGGTVAVARVVETPSKPGSNRTPVLADIPLIGELFKNRNHDKANRELVVFVTAHLVSDGATHPPDFRAWHILRQWNCPPLLLGLTQQLAKVLEPSQRNSPAWQEVAGGGTLRLKLDIEGDLPGEVVVGFFKDARWSAPPVAVRRLSAGTHVLTGLPAGQYQIGAMLGKAPAPLALGVQRAWPAPVEIWSGETAAAEVLVSEAFQKWASGRDNEQTAKDYVGAWGQLDENNLLQGQLTDPGGRPLALGQIMIREHRTDRRGIATADRGTDERGSYKFDEMAWPYTVTARWREPLPSVFGCRYQTMSLNRVLEGSQRIDFRFEPFPQGTGKLTGRVLDQNGRAVEGFFLRVLTLSSDQVRQQREMDGKTNTYTGYDVAFLSKDGSYELGGLPEGAVCAHVIPFEVQRYEYDNLKDVTLTAGQATNLDFQLTGKDVLYGRVLFEDGTPAVLRPSPWKGAVTRLQLTGGYRIAGINEVDAQGYFTLYLDATQREALAAGSSRILINVPTDQERRWEPGGEFPFDKLAPDKAQAGTVTGKQPAPSPQDRQDATNQGDSRAWYVMRQANCPPLLLGLTQQLLKALQPARQNEARWREVAGGGSLKLDVKVEQEQGREIVIGLFGDAKWSREPVAVRLLPKEGTYTLSGLPAGRYQIGAMIGHGQAQNLSAGQAERLVAVGRRVSLPEVVGRQNPGGYPDHQAA